MNRTVLVVDDDRGIREVMIEFLQDEGFGVVAGGKRGGRWLTLEAAVRRSQAEVASGAIPTGRPRRKDAW